MGKPLQQRRDGRTRDTRQRIEDVALGLFVTKGVAQTSLQEIADRLELTKAALYYHFPSKADLVRSLVQPAVDDINTFLADAEANPPDRRTLLEGFFDVNYAHRMVLLAVNRDPSVLADVDAADWVPRLVEQSQRLLAGDDPPLDMRIRAMMALNGLSRCATFLPDVDHDELRRTAVDVALQTLDAGA